MFFFERETNEREREKVDQEEILTRQRTFIQKKKNKSFVSLLSWRDLRRIAARDKKTPLESARFGFKSNNNNTFLIIVSSIASPHPKVVRYSSHRAGRIERERDYIYV